MKEILLLLTFLAVAHVTTCAFIQQRNEESCLVENEVSAGPECYNFYLCRNGMLEIVECPSGLLWNDFISRCDLEENVQCEDEQTTTTTTTTTEEPSTEAPTSPPTTSAPSNTFIPETEGALPIVYPQYECPPGIRAFRLHPTDCRRYSYCLYGIEYPQVCPFLEKFHYVLGHCVHQDQAECFPGSE